MTEEERESERRFAEEHEFDCTIEIGHYVRVLRDAGLEVPVINLQGKKASQVLHEIHEKFGPIEELEKKHPPKPVTLEGIMERIRKMKNSKNG